MEAEQIRADAAQLASFGYRQQLTRALGLWSNFSLGFTYLWPVVGVYTLFAFGLATAGPAFGRSRSSSPDSSWSSSPSARSRPSIRSPAASTSGANNYWVIATRGSRGGSTSGPCS